MGYSTFTHLNLTIPHILFSSFLAFLAYCQLSPWIILSFVSFALYIVHLEAKEKHIHQEQIEAAKVQQTQSETARSNPPPEFVNHAIEALWPMINQDLFIPVLDLLEDTLQLECPAVVHSVRVESLSLGSKPMKINWLRPLTDHEWGDGMGGDNPGDRPNDGQLDGKNAVQGGSYVSFEISFDLNSAVDKPANKAGILVYFGVGLKGLGGVELPVWIDMVQVTGILRLRLLLDPSPPFVRTGTFYFPTLPVIDIAASPLKRHGLGSMNAIKVVPGLRSYVLSCMTRVAKAFVKPECFTLDLDRILSGQEGMVRTKNIGIFMIRLHSAQNIRAADPNGKSDPYIAIAWGKQLNKPLFSTRTLLKTLNPVWEETAMILVPGDAVTTGEKLVLQLYDSDRFNADDSLGIVEVDLAEMVSRGDKLYSSRGPTTDEHQLDQFSSPFQPARHKSSQRPQGVLQWSIRFYPLATFTDPEFAHGPSQADSSQATGDENMSANQLAAETKEDEKDFLQEERDVGRKMMTTAWPLVHLGEILKKTEWATRALDILKPEPFEWETERLARRKDAVRWLLGTKDREVQENHLALDKKFRSGILRWNIIQLSELAVRPSSGEFTKSARSSAGGKPALAEKQETEADQEDPVSSYVEVLVNDRLVFRTRTKRHNNAPYVNAASERFIRDWTMERLKIVVRDERDREHDPILGIIDLSTLGDVFGNKSEVTRWYPLAGGIGWGVLRLSLLWKPIDISLPKGISGFDIVSAEIHSVKAIDLSNVPSEHIASSSVTIDTESDSKTISSDPYATSSSAASESTNANESRRRSGSANSAIASGTYAWEIQQPPLLLAVCYRLSTSMIIRFSNKQGSIKRKTTTWGIGVLRLVDVPDGVLMNVAIPIFATSDPAEAILWAFSKDARNETNRAKEIGVILLGISLRPGLGKAHQHLLKKDRSLNLVHEAKQATTLLGIKQHVLRSTSDMPSHQLMEVEPLERLDSRISQKSQSGSVQPTRADEISGANTTPINGFQRDHRSSYISNRSLSGVGIDIGTNDIEQNALGAADGRTSVEGEGGKKEEEEEEEDFYDGTSSKSSNKRITHEGKYQYKALRSARWAKDKVSSKVSQISLKHKRQTDGNRSLETEGISSF
ncbi:Ca2-dependent lipid-binding protein CLB1/vesicle protein vp115/Granuphilin A, contains C2 domain [Phaffia rhodozyma]|uniref:Ca2-dependent lipid-binding protein CLB1/vesicle protein vp115/Granuphilin A, contains C2 domain n=1 Tax=Phaffia rhodozyma TaxID=264483 RepID=A0A0F7SQ12_PHARH|nr:Ca2-dependent lipid-binding protein CLB1/vesicle protein vp115/Granuphilin A, contains C2 domain [Phaffia rhodozyma]